MTVCYRRLLAIVAVGVLACFAGCSNSEQNTGLRILKQDETDGSEYESAILTHIAAKNRNTVHVVLWTLKHNNIDVPSTVDFDLPYKSNKEALTSVAGKLAELDASKLQELDDSLDQHMQQYSPIYGPMKENWN